MTGIQPTKEKALVDTNILFYLVDKKAGQKHERAKAWFESVIEKRGLFVSTQNLREFSNIALKKTSFSANEINLVLELFEGSFNTVPDNSEDIKKANFFCENNRKNFWDSLLAATMQRHGIKTIITENTKDFKMLKIKAVNIFQKN